MSLKGYRKFLLALVYMAGMFTVGALVVLRHSGDLLDVGAMAGGIASGLGVIVWGNAQEWKTQSGNGQQVAKQ